MARLTAAIAANLLLLVTTASCASAALAPSNANACAAAAAYSTEHGGVSVLVVHDGQTVCEDYATGGPERGYEIWSGTKSFNGIIAAAAVQDGLLRLDEPVSDTLTEWRADPDRASITIRQLLSLTSGVSSRPGRAPTYTQAIGAPLAAPPGDRFIYGSAPFQIFGAVMQRKLAAAGRDPDPLHYLRSRVFEPIGVTWTNWRRTEDGEPFLPQGASFNARQWARFGEFVRAGGVVDGRTLIDPEAFEELFQGSTAHPGYGLGWWLSRQSGAPDVVTASVDIGAHADELPSDLIIAAGAGDQRLYVIPSLSLTIVRQTDHNPLRAGTQGSGWPQGWSDFAFLSIVLAEWGARHE